MEDRITRLEVKIDKLTEVIVTLATVEEKIRSVNHRVANLENGIQTFYLELKEFKEDFHKLTLETKPAVESQSQFKWIAIASAVGAIFTAIATKFT